MKTCWLLALAGLLGLAGTTQAGSTGLTNLLLPQIFGQDRLPAVAAAVAGTAPQSPSSYPRIGEALPAPVVAMPDDGDDDEWLADLLMDSISFCRMLFGMNRHQEIDMIAEVVVRLATAPRDPDGTPLRASAPEVLPLPRPLPRPVAGAGVPCPPCCAQACGSSSVKVGCPSTFACPTGAAKPCSSAADKACKCCKDCKDCSCGKPEKTGAAIGINGNEGITGSIVLNERNFSILPCPCPPSVVFMPGGDAPNMLPPMPRMLVPGLPMPPPVDGYAQSMPCPFAPPVLHSYGSPMPTCPPVEELKELIRQRQMLTAAIEQLEKELLRMAQQRQSVPAPAAPGAPGAPGVVVSHNAQKVHLVTEHFEAHCDAVHCVEGQPHRVVLEGDVLLTCKKGAQAMRIEAPCVVIDMRDGSFRVQAPTGMTTQPAQPAQWLIPTRMPR